MKINVEELLKHPIVLECADRTIKRLCEYNNLKFLGTYVIPRKAVEGLTEIRVPYDVDDLLRGDGLIGYTDGDVLMIRFSLGTRIFIKNPDR